MPTVDPAKRRRIMQRSMQLGHCICDPRRPCPCDVFTDQGLCPCAGERPDPVDLSQVKLTELVHNAGCASKIAAADLERFLSRLPPVDDPAVISGIPAGDDAGIYRLADGVTIVQTVDVFTPCVDDPEQFGRICAANCLSDIYAMGGTPRTALSILAFPSESQDGRIMHLMLKGAMDVLADAGCALLGGHSIKDEEIKLGFAITGTIDPDRAVALETPAAGDLLVLTKPLGVGVLSFARQIGRGNTNGLARAEASMAALNRQAAEAMVEAGASACTDVTGFGLFGHLVRMTRKSGISARVFVDRLPAFDGALEALRDGIVPGAVERNREFVGDDLLVGDGVDGALVNLGFDAQTSGGLLIAIPQSRHEALLKALADRGVSAWTIGSFTDQADGYIELTTSGDASAVLSRPEPIDSHASQAPARTDDHSEPCCADVFAAASGKGAPASDKGAAASGSGNAAAEALQSFGALMRATSAAGAIDAKTKELITIALVVLARCGPCLDAHLDKARTMGISREELDEAAWCAVAMGGAPVRMFYRDALARAAGTGNKGCC